MVLAQTSRAVEKSWGSKICTPFCRCKGVCLLRFPTKIAEHHLFFIAQPCVMLQPSFQESLWFFQFPSILIRFFLINTLFFFCIIFLIHSGFNSERKSFLMFEHVFYVTCYCAFHKHANFEVQKPTDDWVLSLLSIILTELLGNKILLSQVQKVMVCDLS